MRTVWVGKVISGHFKRDGIFILSNIINKAKTLRRNVNCENLVMMTRNFSKSEEFLTLGFIPWMGPKVLILLK